MIAQEGVSMLTYKLYIYNRKSNEYTKLGEWNTYDTAEGKADKYKKRNVKYKIFAYPKKVKVGLKIYQGDELYGTVVDISESFYYINRVTKGEDDKMFFMKDNFEEKFLNDIFNVKESNHEHREGKK